MRSRLGPQEPGKERPLVAATWEAYPNPPVAPTVQNNPPYQAVRQVGRNSSNEPPPCSISKRLDVMLSTPFSSCIIHYDPPRGFLMPKFSAYDGSSDSFDHIMHYRQLMTLDIGNDALLCKVFPASLQGQALSWFHRLLPNSVITSGTYRKLLWDSTCAPARHKQNISTLQKIKMQENESLREFVKRFGQAVVASGGLQHGCYPPNLQTKHMLGQGEQSRPDLPPLTPLTVSYEKLLPIIQDLFDFKWPGPIRTDPTKRDHSKKCAYHKEHGHTTERCRSLHYLVERLIKAGHLKQYLCSEARVRDTPWSRNFGTSKAPVAPKAVINYIHGGPLDEEYNSRRKKQRLPLATSLCERINSVRLGLTDGSARPIDGTIVFPPVDPTRILQPHRDALILSLGMGDFDVRRILVDPGSSSDLLQASVIKQMGLELSGLENPWADLVGIQWSVNYLPWRRYATGPSRSSHS
ncbi:hypothetical protein CK203_054794 [Vitis vinifera]|uniref:Retrotransposon gag domain-containing protein n=1 Tax=Vitis vinifera TaxID=29760 RepID=A0A438GIN1_VITVI|nr:hypothetical protein CK203_054794 [Vitis vinifera]